MINSQPSGTLCVFSLRLQFLISLFHLRMPSKPRNSIKLDGRILLAIPALKKKKKSQIPTVQQAAHNDFMAQLYSLKSVLMGMD